MAAMVALETGWARSLGARGVSAVRGKTWKASGTACAACPFHRWQGQLRRRRRQPRMDKAALRQRRPHQGEEEEEEELREKRELQEQDRRQRLGPEHFELVAAPQPRCCRVRRSTFAR